MSDALFIGAAALALANAGGTTPPPDKATWCQQMLDYIRYELGSVLTSVDARRLVLAHAAYESGFGTARAAVRGFNVFNITAGSAWGGEKWVDVNGDTDGAGNRITQTWRIYPNPRAAMRDYWEFLGPTQNGGRYTTARDALVSANLPLFASRLGAAGYFGLAVDRYTAGLTAMLAETRLYV